MSRLHCIYGKPNENCARDIHNASMHAEENQLKCLYILSRYSALAISAHGHTVVSVTSWLSLKMSDGG